MASTSLLICTYFCSFLFIVVHCQSQDNCIALRDCPTLFDLLKNRDNLANFTRVDVYTHLKNVNCGFNRTSRSPLVRCPSRYFYFLLSNFRSNKVNLFKTNLNLIHHIVKQGVITYTKL